MQPELANYGHQSVEAFRVLQASLLTSAALARREQRIEFRQLLVEFLQVSQKLLEGALAVGESKGTVKQVAHALGLLDSQRARLRALVTLRPVKVRQQRDLAAYWTPGLNEQCEAMIRAYQDGEAALRRYQPEPNAVRRHMNSLEFRLQVLDAVDALGTDEEHRETWEYLRHALDEDRTSARKLYPE